MVQGVIPTYNILKIYIMYKVRVIKNRDVKVTLIKTGHILYKCFMSYVSIPLYTESFSSTNC